MKEGEGIKQKNKNKDKKLIDTENSIVITREKGEIGEVEDSKGGINGDGRKLDLGRWTYKDDIL